MKKFYTAVFVIITLLTLTRSAVGIGTDCTDPPNLVPFADLTDCDLSGRDMEGVNLSNANLTGANLDDASLFTTILQEATFNNASLRNTIMEDADARQASFVNADMRGVDLYFARVSDANLSGANFANTWLHSVDFEGSNLQNAIFTGSNLRFSELNDTDLRGADLSFTELLYTTLSNADLRNATLLGADRRNGTSLDGVIWGNTTCADGSNSDDDDRDNFTCESNFIVNEPPTVSLTSPADNTTVTTDDTVTISADAADSDGSVVWVEFYANGVRINLDATAPYSYNWSPPVNGTFAITAKATDNDSATTTSPPVTVNVVPSPNNEPPTVILTSPHHNAIIYRGLGTTIQADAADADGSITKVEFYVDSTLLFTDTSAPYSYYWNPTSRGRQTLTARAYDDDGADTTSHPVMVRVR